MNQATSGANLLRNFIQLFFHISLYFVSCFHSARFSWVSLKVKIEVMWRICELKKPSRFSFILLWINNISRLGRGGESRLNYEKCRAHNSSHSSSSAEGRNWGVVNEALIHTQLNVCDPKPKSHSRDFKLTPTWRVFTSQSFIGL